MFYIILSIILFITLGIVDLVIDHSTSFTLFLISGIYFIFTMTSYFDTDDTNIYSQKLPILHVNNISLVTIGNTTKVLDGDIYIQSDSVYVNYFERVRQSKVMDTVYKFEPVLRN